MTSDEYAALSTTLAPLENVVDEALKHLTKLEEALKHG